MEAAAMLGARSMRRIFSVALPLVRPFVAGGVALVLMETLADFGVSSYFGIQTFTAGVIKAWVVMDDLMAATHLSLALLVSVSLLVWLERRARQRMRFASSRGQNRSALMTRVPELVGWQALLTWGLGMIPVLLGFIFPVLMMLRPLLLGVGTAGGAVGAIPALGLEQHPAGHLGRLAGYGTGATLGGAARVLPGASHGAWPGWPRSAMQCRAW